MPSCAVCDDAGARLEFHKDGVEVFECPSCGLRFWVPPDGFRAEALYDAGYFSRSDVDTGYDDYGALEASLRRTFARRLSRIPLPSDGARLLDIGAAYGFAADEARRLGWRIVASEVSPDAAARASRLLRGRVIRGDAGANPFPPSSFNAVTMWDVLEHLARPHRAIADVARVLRPGGCLVLTTGDVRSAVARLSGRWWHLYTIPEHLFFYTRRSLAILLEAHGFRIERMNAESSFFTPAYLVERLRKTVLRRSAVRPPRWPGAGIGIPVNLFDVVTVHAVREAPG